MPSGGPGPSRCGLKHLARVTRSPQQDSSATSIFGRRQSSNGFSSCVRCTAKQPTMATSGNRNCLGRLDNSLLVGPSSVLPPAVVIEGLVASMTAPCADMYQEGESAALPGTTGTSPAQAMLDVRGHSCSCNRSNLSCVEQVGNGLDEAQVRVGGPLRSVILMPRAENACGQGQILAHDEIVASRADPSGRRPRHSRAMCFTPRS
jgi:hypothetical protein